MGDGVSRSTDDGSTWVRLDSGLTERRTTVLVFTPSGLAVAGTAAGIFRIAERGGCWTRVDPSIPNAAVLSLLLAESATGSRLFAATTAGVFTTVDSGTSWIAAGGCLAGRSVQSVVRTPSGTVVAATAGGGVVRSTDGGVSWTAGGAGLSDSTVTCLAVSPGTPLLAGTPRGVFRSTDDGASWTRAASGLADTLVTAVAASPSGLVFAGTRQAGLFFSWDNGDHWYPTPLQQTSITALGAAPSGQLFAGTLFGGIWRSTDGGASWLRANTGLGYPTPARGFVFDGGRRAFVGKTSDGVYVTTDWGVAWSLVGPSQSLSVSALALSSGGELYAGTDGKGVFRYGLLFTGVDEPAACLPDGPLLAQNYPNPFNAGTTMEFRVPGTGSRRVRLSVHDLLGREVAVLADGRMEPGSHSVRFDASGLASGVYFSRLAAGSVVAVRRLLLLR